MTNAARQTIKENLVNSILSNNSVQTDWDSLKENFNSMYPNFFTSMLIKGIQLSKKEEQLLLLETLHFNTNTIAKVLGVLPNSIYTSRYRLKKRIKNTST